MMQIYNQITVRYSRINGSLNTEKGKEGRRRREFEQ